MEELELIFTGNSEVERNMLEMWIDTGCSLIVRCDGRSQIRLSPEDIKKNAQEQEQFGKEYEVDNSNYDSGIWVPLSDFGGFFDISLHGKVRYQGGGVLDQKIDKKGHVTVSLWDEKADKHKYFRVAELLLPAFATPRPNRKAKIHHIDGDKTNNDHTNLTWK